MTGFLVRRLGWSIAVLSAVFLATFVLAYVVPADPARAIAGIRASPEDVARIRHSLGLDAPLLEQLLAYVRRLVSGDLGYSFSNRRPVLELMVQRLPATLELAAAGLFVELAIGLPVGVGAALRRGRAFDRLANLYAGLAAGMPAFWLGYLLLLGLAFLPAVDLGLTIFPIGGYESGDLRHLALPALTLGIVGSAYYVRLMRTSLIDELGQNYLATARAKGLTERRVIWRHAVRNALTPIVTQLGLDMGLLLGGVVVVERVFSWPGIGKLAIDGVFHGDVPVIMGTVLFGTLVVLLGNLLADVANVIIDPRLRVAA